MPDVIEVTFYSTINQFLHLGERVTTLEVIAFVGYLDIFHSRSSVSPPSSTSGHTLRAVHFRTRGSRVRQNRQWIYVALPECNLPFGPSPSRLTLDYCRANCLESLHRPSQCRAEAPGLGVLEEMNEPYHLVEILHRINCLRQLTGMAIS